MVTNHLQYFSKEGTKQKRGKALNNSEEFVIKFLISHALDSVEEFITDDDLKGFFRVEAAFSDTDIQAMYAITEKIGRFKNPQKKFIKIADSTCTD